MSTQQEPDKATATKNTQRVRIEGHIIDSLILPNVLDIILREQADYQISEIDIGRQRTDPSFAELVIRADSEEQLQAILAKLTPHGVVALDANDCQDEPADVEGAFPERFYSTTNLKTEIRVEANG